MKKRTYAFTGFLLFFTMALLSCASTKTLTPYEINNSIRGLQNLQECQFYISQDVTLYYAGTEPNTGFDRQGVVILQDRTQQISLKIRRSEGGILQTKNSSGESMLGYEEKTINGSPVLTLRILFFRGDNDKAIEFDAVYDIDEDRFQLVADEVVFDGKTYQIIYSGEEMPYLYYKFRDKRSEESITIRAGGRKVGSI